MSALKNPFRREPSGASGQMQTPASAAAPGQPVPQQPNQYTASAQQPFQPGGYAGTPPMQSAGYFKQVPPGAVPQSAPGQSGGYFRQPTKGNAANGAVPPQVPGYAPRPGMTHNTMARQTPGYAPPPDMLQNTTARQPVGYPGPSQNPQGTCFQPPAGYTGQAPRGTGYAGQVPQGTGFQPSAGYTGQAPQGTGYAGQVQGQFPQGTGFQPPAGYAGQAPNATGYAGPVHRQAPGGTGYAGPVPPGSGSIPVPGSGSIPPQADASSQAPRQDGTGGGEDRKKEFRFRPSFFPPAEDRKKVTITPLHIGIIISALVLTVWYLFVNYAPQAATTATVRAGRYGTYHTGDALIVRNEVPYDADSITSIQYTADEGTAVSNQSEICRVFSSGFSTRELTSLQDYRDQIRDYERQLLAEETTYDARLDRVESEVLAQALEVRSMIAGTLQGSLQNMETSLGGAITARQQYLQEKYSNDQRLTRLLNDEQSQQQRIDSWTKVYYSTKASLVSFYTDGFEYGLNINNCLNYTPAEVRSMIRGNIPDGTGPAKSKTPIYRTITDDVWYVLMLCHDTSWNPVENAEYNLELNQFDNTDVKATVVSYSRAGGELLVRLRVEGGVDSVLYMRTGTVRIGDNISTMLVPARALYHQNDMEGVVIIDGGNQFFVPVQIVYRDGDDVYVNSLTTGLLFEGQTVMLF